MEIKLYKTIRKEKKQELVKKHWYFQGFNGTPALLSAPTIGNVKDCWDVLGYGYSIIIEFYEGDKCYYLYDWEDLEKNLQIILEKVKQNKGYLQWMLEKDNELREAHEKVMKKLEAIDIQKLPFKEALRLYNEFSASYRKAIGVSLIIECFTYPTEELIRNTIKDELKAKGKSKEEIEETQTLLTAAIEPSFIGKHQRELLKLAWIKKKNEKEFPKKIEEYQKRMFWMNNAYAGAKVLPIEHFIHEVEEILKKYTEPEKELQKIQAHFTTVKQRKKECIDKNALSENLRMLIEINDIVGIIHDVRKEVITHSDHFIDKFLKRFGKEKNTPLELMRYLSEYEITEESLKKINSEELKKRKQKSVFITLHSGEQYIFTGKEAEEMIAALTKEHVHEEQEILKGHCASQGHAIGTVKVCRGLEEIPKLKEGDILVACMTQPEFVPAMKKAAAIVTDEGGLTCHAAIISRELGKPCIISTKKATRILKDGMTVEVNATEGYVKILKV